ncbi:hypothetical protein [Gordonia sp. (in: high G+C Gram-positive bacteria)]|uniref:hypothetical protein n=1 Tax=Gordonia sp. (in: high G+C Gram-positive bacteria) TaxID=84139 RepID=UPI0039E5D37C
MSPAASTSGLWQRAVQVGHRGDIAEAREILSDLDDAVGPSRDPDDRALVSLAQSTRASWLRQSGRHDLAHRLDGRAVYTAVDAAGPPPVSGWPRAALADALIGLAADNLGLGRFDASTGLLDEAADVLAAPAETDDWHLDGRLRLRRLWVAAENALYRGEGERGRQEALAAVTAAADCPSSHHRIKTSLIAAAAAAACGDTVEATTRARAVVDDAGALALLPLQWAAWQLLAGLGSDSDARRRVDETAESLTESGFFRAPEFGSAVDGG